MIKLPYLRLSLAQQFLAASFPVLLVGMLLIGAGMSKQIENRVAHRVGAMTGMYMDTFVEPHVQSLVKSEDLNADERAALAQVLNIAPLREKVVAFKVWGRDGRVLYSDTPALIGRSFPIGEGLKTALSGYVHSEVSNLNGAENELDRTKWTHLIETYVPLHARGIGSVIAVAEFYHTTEQLTSESRTAQIQSWSLLALILIGMYVLLFALVRKGSKTIDMQQRELNLKVSELTKLVTQNEKLHDRVRRAAVHTTALNEVFLRRISADLHDGPGQDMGFALMQMESMRDTDIVQQDGSHGSLSSSEEFHAIRTALHSALKDLRAISAGLQLPEIEQLSISEIAERAIRDYESKTGAKVTLMAPLVSDISSQSIKIALYRLLQESLTNGFRHAKSLNQQVKLKVETGSLLIQVSDSGAGFDPNLVLPDGHQGLSGMRERVEILGGSFDLQSTPGHGTTIRVMLPLVVHGPELESI